MMGVGTLFNNLIATEGLSKWGQSKIKNLV